MTKRTEDTDPGCLLVAIAALATAFAAGFLCGLLAAT
jgi:hypothetical protein